MSTVSVEASEAELDSLDLSWTSDVENSTGLKLVHPDDETEHPVDKGHSKKVQVHGMQSPMSLALNLSDIDVQGGGWYCF